MRSICRCHPFTKCEINIVVKGKECGSELDYNLLSLNTTCSFETEDQQIRVNIRTF
jgi:hypothetical protein